MWQNANKPDFGTLSDLKVVSASSSLAGPFIATIFAEYGADVVWVENADMPDFTRGTPNWQCEGERRNCRDVALRLSSPEGREALLRLIEDADIFIESSKGGQFDRLQLSDEVLWQRNPKLVIGHISGFGQTGVPDYVKRPSFDAIGQAFSGYMNENRNPLTPPYAVGQFASDYTTSLYTGLALLAAWHHAQRTGQGESIDASQYEYMMRISIYGIDWFTNHRTFPTAGEQNVNAGWGTYECKDGYIFCCFNGAAVMKRGNELLGLPYGTDVFPEGSATWSMEKEAGPIFLEALKEWLAQRTVVEAEREMLDHNIPVSRINTWADVEADPHVQAREDIIEWESVKGTKIRAVAPLPKFKNNPGKVWGPCPAFGQHNEEVLSELGYSSEEIAQLYAEGIIANDPELKYSR